MASRLRLASLLPALLAVMAVALVAAPQAWSHASLVSTEPARGAVLEAPPTEVIFNFNEAVEIELGGIRLFDAAGNVIPTGEVTRPSGSQKSIAASVPDDLGDGTYTATYRTISADSHPISGGFLFTVGEPGDGPALTVGELLSSSEAGPVTDGAFWLVRLLGYVAIGLGVGIVAFTLLVWNPAFRAGRRAGGNWAAAGDAIARRLNRLMVASAAVGVICAIAALGLQAASATGQSFFDVFTNGSVGDVAATRFGQMAIVRAVGWILLAVAFVAGSKVLVARSETNEARPAWAGALLAVAVLLAVAITATPMLSGHASVYDPTWLLAPADLLHLLAMSVWFGGLALLAFALPAATRQLEGADRPALLAAALMRFSPLALVSVVVLTVTGAAQAIIYLDSFANFVDTAFGRALLVKIVLLLVLVGLGALNRQRMLPALQKIVDRKESATGKVGLALRRTIRAEVLLLVAVLGATAVLVTTVPSGSEMAGPASGNVIAESGDIRLEYTVDPATTGANELHLYLFSEADGSQYDAEEVTAEATLSAENIGPIPIDLTKSGPGHYTGPSAPFGVQGDWQVDVHVRTSRFDQTNLDFEVEIR